MERSHVRLPFKLDTRQCPSDPNLTFYVYVSQPFRDAVTRPDYCAVRLTRDNCSSFHNEKCTCADDGGLVIFKKTVTIADRGSWIWQTAGGFAKEVVFDIQETPEITTTTRTRGEGRIRGRERTDNILSSSPALSPEGADSVKNSPEPVKNESRKKGVERLGGDNDGTVNEESIGDGVNVANTHDDSLRSSLIKDVVVGVLNVLTIIVVLVVVFVCRNRRARRSKRSPQEALPPLPIDVANNTAVLRSGRDGARERCLLSTSNEYEELPIPRGAFDNSLYLVSFTMEQSCEDNTYTTLT
ncbi:uncharacterized protein [Littorina saxatilis]|uniref:Uncharacterized protein n=2 Tax=Littorina saxatilis TaxID=31220 RepID=A0AAN9BIL7_9CAEN